MSWQRDNLQAAAAYFRERIAAGEDTSRTRSLYEGLLEVMDPARRATRVQREMAAAAKAAAAIKAERRAAERRRAADRRKVNFGSPTGVERRNGADRRSGEDRRDRR